MGLISKGRGLEGERRGNEGREREQGEGREKERRIGEELPYQ